MTTIKQSNKIMIDNSKLYQYQYVFTSSYYKLQSNKLGLKEQVFLMQRSNREY